MTTHTPGPWFVSDKGHVYSVAHYRPAPFVSEDGTRYDDHMAGLVALTYAPDAPNGDSSANALLIAAAPALLHALRREHHEQYESSNGAMRCQDLGQSCDVCDLIAKAEGK